MKISCIATLAFLTLTLDAEPIREGCFIRATILPIAEPSANEIVIATSHDPRFTIRIKVNELVAGSHLLNPGDEKTFAIHSLAMMFPEEQPNTSTKAIEGKSYLFLLQKTTLADGITSFRLDRGEHLYEQEIENKKPTD